MPLTLVPFISILNNNSANNGDKKKEATIKIILYINPLTTFLLPLIAPDNIPSKKTKTNTVKIVGYLKENNLEVKEIIAPISARLIGNKASFKFKTEEIEKVIKCLGELVKND